LSASLRCPHCRERVFQKSAGGGVKVRTTLLIFQEDDRALVKCRKCKADLYIEASLGEELRKALAVPSRRVVVTRGLRAKSIDPPDSAQ
jgi:hypothetical protein